MENDKQPYWFSYVQEEDPADILEVIEEVKITSGKQTLHLDIYDPKNTTSPTLVFVHGTAVYGRFYAELLYKLYKEGVRVVSVDLQGHGYSTGSRGHFRIEELVQNVHDTTTYVIDRFGPEVAISGSSLGGIVSFYSVANDNRIQVAICNNLAILSDGTMKEMLHLPLYLRLATPFMFLFARLLPRLKLSVWNYLQPDSLVETDVARELIDIFLKDPLISPKYSLRALYSQSVAKLRREGNPIRPAEVITPIVVINGTADPLFTVAYAQKVLNQLNCEKELVKLDGANHLLLHERTNEVIPIYSNALKKYFPNFKPTSGQ